MFLLPSNAKAWAHHSAVILSTCADANAAKCCPSQAALVVGKFEVRFGAPRLVIRSESQVFVQLVWANELSRIHLPVWIPKRFEFGKCLDQLGTEHLWIEFRARLPIAMFAGKRSTERDHQIRGFFHEVAEFLDPFGRMQTEIHAIVHTAIAEMAVHHATILIRIGELFERA